MIYNSYTPEKYEEFKRNIKIGMYVSHCCHLDIRKIESEEDIFDVFDMIEEDFMGHAMSDSYDELYEEMK